MAPVVFLIFGPVGVSSIKKMFVLFLTGVFDVL
jgi:hypothetical protein